jgi:hypothetical protein
VDDLAQWLRAQLDADAEQARTAAEELGPDWYYDDGFVLARREDDMVATGSQDFLERERGVFIAAHDPARVLREVQAKRGIVARYEFACREAAALDIGEEERETRVASAAAFQLCVLLLAAVYEDRPGFAEAIASVE